MASLSIRWLNSVNIPYRCRVPVVAGKCSQSLSESSVRSGSPKIRRAIAEGEADPGDRIPQAKDLAAVLGVNTNTVLRALRVLRDEGLVELGRGRAIVVAGTPERSAVVARMKEFLEFARSQGYRRDEVLTMMEPLP